MYNAAKLYATFEAESMGRDARMPLKAQAAWMAACDNAGTSHPIDSALYKAAALDSLSMTSAFEENEAVRAYFESFGYTY